MQSTKTTDQADRWTQDEFEARIEELLSEARSTPVDRKHDARRASNGSSIAMTDEERELRGVRREPRSPRRRSRQ